MKKYISIAIIVLIVCFCFQQSSHAQSKTFKKGNKYDTIIVKHSPYKAKKTIVPEIILPTPEYINQPYYFDRSGNKLIKLENANALMVTNKKTLGLKGAKQILSMDAAFIKIIRLINKFWYGQNNFLHYWFRYCFFNNGFLMLYNNGIVFCPLFYCFCLAQCYGW